MLCWALLAIAIAISFETFGQQAFAFMIAFYNVTFALMFLTINILYIVIIAKLIRNRRNLRQVTKDNG